PIEAAARASQGRGQAYRASGQEAGRPGQEPGAAREGAPAPGDGDRSTPGNPRTQISSVHGADYERHPRPDTGRCATAALLLRDQAAAREADRAGGAGGAARTTVGDAGGAGTLAGRRRRAGVADHHPGVGGAGVGAGRRRDDAAGVGGRLAHANLALATGVHTRGLLRAGRAGGGIVELGGVAGGDEQYVEALAVSGDRAAAEAVAAVGGHPLAVLDALVGLLLGAVVEVLVIRTGLGRVGAGVGGIALEVPVAAVVALARVAVEEAVL